MELGGQVRPALWFSQFGDLACLDGGIDDKPVNGMMAGDRLRLQPRDQAPGGVTLVNVRAGLGFGERFQKAGVARKLTGKDHPLDAGKTGGAFGDPAFIPAEPRFYGVQPTERQQAQDGSSSHLGQ